MSAGDMDEVTTAISVSLMKGAGYSFNYFHNRGIKVAGRYSEKEMKNVFYNALWSFGTADASPSMRAERRPQLPWRM